MQLWYSRVLALVLAGAWALSALAIARADGWGTIKGQVVFDGKDVPPRKAIDLGQNQDRAACQKNGPLLDDKLVINPKNKGVRWAAVYLMSAEKNGFTKPIPIHPSLKEIKQKVVEVDQPCCQFEPHVLALREGQTLVVKNSAAFSHNVNVGPVPAINQLVPPGKQFTLNNLKVRRQTPLLIACNIHGWMTGKVFVLPNPYFAVTDADGKFEIKDAPAGDFRIVIWHEAPGWVVGDDKPTKNANKITIKDKETTDLGKILMILPKD